MGTIRLLKKWITDNPSQAIFQSIRALAGAYDFCREYDTNHANIDRLFVRKFAGGHVLDFDEIVCDVDDMRSALDLTAIDEVLANAEQWERLYKTTVVEFNPLWNVDGTTTTTRTPNLKKSNKAYTDGRTNTYGAVNEEDATKNYPFDDVTTGANVTKNTHTENARTDSETISGGAREESETGNEVIEEVRQGNIGVTETTTLLSHTQQFYTNYKFWNEFLTFIFGVTCKWSESFRAETSESGGGGGGSVEVTAEATAETLEAGEDATASVSCVDNHLSFLFGIPRGADGEKGDKGDDGTSADIVSATASVSAGASPACVVTVGGSPLERTFNFAFSGIGGASGKYYTINTFGNTSSDAVIRVRTYENGVVTSTEDVNANNVVQTWRTFDCFRIGYAFTAGSWSIETFANCKEYATPANITWGYMNIMNETFSVGGV